MMVNKTTDLTALRLAAIVEWSDDAIVSKDARGFITSWNRSAERIFGFTADEAIGKHITLIIPDERRGEEDTIFKRILANKVVDHFETVRRRKDGTLIHISLTVSPIRDPDGEVIGASKIARDITERKRSEAAMSELAAENARAYQQAREANRLKDEFLATLSHELRTPLNAILGYARILSMKMLDAEKQAAAVTVIERNANSLKQIIEDVLDISSIVAGKLRLHVQPVSLPDVIRSAVATIAPAAEARGVTLQTIVDPLVPAVSGDPDRLQQVVWNLVANAVKFTPRGGRVQTQLARVNSHVEIVVSDTGRGIDPGFLPHLFERFRQADSSLTRDQGGLGLGLAIVRELVESHGGSVVASSDGAGTGATFRVRLPVMIVHQESHPEKTRAHPQSEQPRGPQAFMRRLDGLSVLAIDDETDARSLLKEILESAGARTVVAASAADALKLLEQSPWPDVIVADIGMPGVDGFEFIRGLRRLEGPASRIPAAALTAYARSEDRITSIASGFQMHIAKPVDPTELIVAISSLARSRS